MFYRANDFIIEPRKEINVCQVEDMGEKTQHNSALVVLRTILTTPITLSFTKFSNTLLFNADYASISDSTYLFPSFCI